MRAAIAAVALLACAYPASAEPPTNTVKARVVAVDEVVQSMSLPGIEVGVAYTSCGMINAFYLPATHQIVMCVETLDEPVDAVRFITAHEMAHAIIGQYRIPVPGSEEAAADELAAVAMGLTDNAQVTLDMAVWYKQHPDGGEDVTDDHQSSAKRAAVLACLGDGSNEDAVDPFCRGVYLKAVQTWARLISTFKPETA